MFVYDRTVVIAVDSHMVVFDPPEDESPEFYFKGVKQNCEYLSFYFMRLFIKLEALLILMNPCRSTSEKKQKHKTCV